MIKNDRSIDSSETFPLIFGHYSGDQIPAVAVRFLGRFGVLTSSGWRSLYDAAVGLESALEAEDAAGLGWVATHRIMTDSGEIIDVMLDDGAAYSALEWAATDSADYECDEAGRWLFHGQPFAGTVDRINESA